MHGEPRRHTGVGARAGIREGLATETPGLLIYVSQRVRQRFKLMEPGVRVTHCASGDEGGRRSGAPCTRQMSEVSSPGHC